MRRFGAKSLIAAVCAGLAAASACAPSDGPDRDAAQPEAHALAASLPSYIDEMEGVLDETVFKGVRVHRARHFVSDPSSASLIPTSDVLETRELVASDGAGSYAIELVDTIQLPAAFDPVAFPITFERSVDSRWHLREFRVRSFDAMVGNYAVVVPGISTTVAGRTCERIELSRYVPTETRPGHYVLDVDPTTAFVLAMRELDETGATIQEFEYESIDFAPSLANVSLRDGEFDRVPLDLSSPLEQQIGFEVHFPDLLPDGFGFVEASQLDVPAGLVPTGDVEPVLPTGSWVRLEATDGVEALRFAHASGPDTGNSTSSVVRVVEEGAWRVAFGRVRGVAIVCLGRVGPQSLRRLVESAF